MQIQLKVFSGLNIWWNKTLCIHREKLAADGSGTQQSISLILNFFRVCRMNCQKLSKGKREKKDVLLLKTI